MKKNKDINSILLKLVFVIFLACSCNNKIHFESDISDSIPKPWTDKPINGDMNNISFVVFGDIKGIEFPGKTEACFKQIEKENVSFVVSVGDLIKGFTRSDSALNSQWNEFNAFSSQLSSRFFRVVGNHDVSNSFCLSYWKKHYSRDYYYFRVADLLFLCLNTMDTVKSDLSETDEASVYNYLIEMTQKVVNNKSNGLDAIKKDFQGMKSYGEASISDNQYKYFKQVLNMNEDASWTFVIMHMPAWQDSYKCNNFRLLENDLKKRNYSVFAGHEHRFKKDSVNGNAYFIIGPSGAAPRSNSKEYQDQYCIVKFVNKKPVINIKYVE